MPTEWVAFSNPFYYYFSNFKNYPAMPSDKIFTFSIAASPIDFIKLLF